MTPYTIVLHEEAAQFLVAVNRAEQRRLAVIFDRLRSAPFTVGELRERDASGRINEISVVDDWLVTFWTDHAVREIRIVRVESVGD